MIERLLNRWSRKSQLDIVYTHYQSTWIRHNPDGGEFFDMNINDWINDLTIRGENSRTHLRTRQAMETEIEILKSLRDKNHANTLRDAIEALAYRRVNRNLVSTWIDESSDTIGMTTAAAGIRIGYPEFAKKIDATSRLRQRHGRRYSNY